MGQAEVSSVKHPIHMSSCTCSNFARPFGF